MIRFAVCHTLISLISLCQCNIVVCATYDFLQKPEISQKFKMTNLKIVSIILLLNGIIFYTVWVKVYTQKVNNSYEIEDEKCRTCMCTIGFSCQCNIVVCTVYDFLRYCTYDYIALTRRIAFNSKDNVIDLSLVIKYPGGRSTIYSSIKAIQGCATQINGFFFQKKSLDMGPLFRGKLILFSKMFKIFGVCHLKFLQFWKICLYYEENP